MNLERVVETPCRDFGPRLTQIFARRGPRQLPEHDSIGSKERKQNETRPLIFSRVYRTTRESIPATLGAGGGSLRGHPRRDRNGSRAGSPSLSLSLSLSRFRKKNDARGACVRQNVDVV